ncbi:hypothetical protein PS619_01023 [Pseudomonas fluorescens]|nr:hypothetical protein PS619_01023 [Pseudomonas fluorescens]
MSTQGILGRLRLPLFFVSWRPLGRPGFGWFCVYIRFLGYGGLGFRPYGGSLFPDAEKVTKKACSYVRPARWGSGFLRSGIDPGAASPVCFAAPPLAVFGCAKRSLRSHARINPSTQPSDVARGSRSRSRAGELTLGLLSGEERVFGFGSVLDSPLTPALSRGRGSRFVSFSESEFNVVSHVGVPPPNTAVSPLSLRESARVRGS